MGNCFTLPNRNSSVQEAGHKKILRIMKTDGKILEYRSSIPVKDLLVNFPDYGVGSLKEASQQLSHSYELKIGQMYYLLPSSDFSGPVSSEDISPLAEVNQSSSIKRIKVIISKQQLQELLSKKVSMEEVLSGIQQGTWDSSSTNWRPKLDTILEENE